MSPPVSQSKGPVIINGKTAQKGKSSAKNPSKWSIKSLTTQNQTKAHKSPSGDNVETLPPV